MSRNNRSGKKKNSTSSTRVEKTIQIVKEKEFVQRDEFHNAEDPLPEVTLRDLDKQKRRREKNERKQRIAEEKRQKAIRLNSAENEEAESSSENKPEKQKTPKVKNKSEESNVTDIKAARRKEKNKKRLKNAIILVIIAGFAVTVYGLRDLWVPKLEGILDRPHETIVNDGKTVSGNFPLSVNENSVSAITSFDSYLVKLDDNAIQFYSESGEEINSFNHSYADPVLKTAAKRMLLYDKGGNAFKVVNKKNEFFENKTDNGIILAEIADNSYAAVVTQSEKYASVLTIYDNNGLEIYNWSSSARILNVEFNKDGTGCYITTFSSNGGELKSVVRYIVFDSTEEVMKSVSLDCLVLDVKRSDDGDIWAVGDSCLYKLDNDGNALLKYDYDSELVDFDLSEGCASLTFMGVKRKTGKLVIFESNSESGEPDSVIETDAGYPKKLHVKDGKIILLNENDIEAYDFSGNLLATAEVSSEYVDFTFFNESVYFLGYREINKIAFST